MFTEEGGKLGDVLQQKPWGARHNAVILEHIIKKKLPHNNARIIMFWKTKNKLENFTIPRCSTHWFQAAGAVPHRSRSRLKPRGPREPASPNYNQILKHRLLLIHSIQCGTTQFILLNTDLLELNFYFNSFLISDIF